MTAPAKSLPSLTLTVTDLSAERGQRTILQNVNLMVNAGDIVILRGENGAGKTTFLRTLAGLLPRTSEALTLSRDGAAIPTNDIRENVLFIGHKNGIDDAFTVEENLRFWCKLYGVLKTKAAPAAQAVGLGEALDKPARILSAGQKRRLALGRALVADKPIWLFDEPTASLDAASKHLVFDILEHHRQAGGIALIATHEDIPLSAARSFEFGAT